MIALLLYTAAAFGNDARVAVRAIDGASVVDASGTSVDPKVLLRQLAEASGHALSGEDLLANTDPVDVHLHDRPLESVLLALALATNTSITADARTITVAPARSQETPEDLELEAQAAWLRIVRDFPDQEASRVARLELGREQERLGHEDAALAHYDATVRADGASPAMELALQASSELLERRGEWGEAQRRLSQLAVHASSDSVRAAARIATARALAMQGRGTEALALLDAVDLSYPPHTEREAQERKLVRARGSLAAGNPQQALHELDQRAAVHASLGLTAEDLELRARALEVAGSPLESSRAWLACASLSSGRQRSDALTCAARLASAGGDDLAVLFIAQLAQGDAQNTAVKRLSADARKHLGFGGAEPETVEVLESSWKKRAGLAPAERVSLAARCVTAVAHARTIEDAAKFARSALTELDGVDAAPVRAALAASYERRGQWSTAARVWSGGDF
jgi:tetratricopeptide (TPR) repeat protein